MKKALKVISLVLAMVCCAVMFIACVPATPEKAEKKLEKKGYTVTVIEVDGLASLGAPDGCECYVTGINEDGEMVGAYYFDKASNAKDYYEDLKELAEDEDDIVVKKSGKVVVAATEQGWKDFN